jgi:hypothetical protein
MHFVAPTPIVIVDNDPVEAQRRARKEFWTNFGKSFAISASVSFVSTLAVLVAVANSNKETESEDKDL